MKSQHVRKLCLILFSLLGLATLFAPLGMRQPLLAYPANSDLSATPRLPWLNKRTPANVTFVEAEDTGLVTYSGLDWSTKTCIYCSGGEYRRSGEAQDKASLTFDGTAISIVFVGDALSGIVEISIDGTPYPPLNLFNNAAGFDPDPVEYIVAAGLTPGPHTLQVNVTGQNGYTYTLSRPSRRVGIDGFRYGDFPFGALRGRVLDPDGDGIPGAVLDISSGVETYMVNTAYDGLFNLSGLPGAAYTVTASAGGYGAQTITGLPVTAGNETPVADIILPEATGHPLYDRIYTPHANVPAIQPAGTPLTIRVKTESKADNWSASLSTPYNTYALSIISASYDPITAWTLQAAIPAGTPAELYDLTVNWTPGSDTQVRAVQVVAQYSDPFYFVVLGDPQAATIEPGQPTINRTVDEINLINPAFVLVVGDVIDDDPALELDDEYEAYLTAINRLKAPSYSVPGNHDVGSVGAVPALAWWKKYLGRRYYDFDYGPYHFTGMDNAILHFIDPDLADVGGYFADQVAWAQADLASHQDSLLRILFLHISEQPPAGSRPTDWKPDWIDDLQTNMVFYGHLGENQVEILGETPVHWVETRDVIDGRYRLVRINNGVIGPYTYDGSSSRGIPIYNLHLSFFPANDGSHDAVTATIDNQLLEHFEHALLRFVMPKYGCYKTDSGEITQSVDSDDGLTTLVYVALDIPADLETNVTVSQCPTADLKLYLPLISRYP